MDVAIFNESNKNKSRGEYSIEYSYYPRFYL